MYHNKYIPRLRQHIVRHVAFYDMVIPHPRCASKAIQVWRLMDDGPKDNRRNKGDEIPSQASLCLLVFD